MTVQDLLTAGGVDSAMGEQASVPCEVNPRLVEYYFEVCWWPFGWV